MTIGGAVDALRRGRMVRRPGWNGKGMWLGLQDGDPGASRLPFVWICTAQGQLVPWVCSQTDLLADDWEVVL